MTLFFIGEIISSEVIERANKSTGVVTQYCVVNVMLKLVTASGKPKVYCEDIFLPIKYKQLIEQSIGKYIVIPYNYISTKDNAFLFVDEKYSPQILESDPFQVRANKKVA